MSDKQPEALQDPQMQMWLEYCAMKEEVARLHEINAELVEALERIAGFTYSQFADSKDMAIECVMVACKALAKAQGDSNA